MLHLYFFGKTHTELQSWHAKLLIELWRRASYKMLLADTPQTQVWFDIRAEGWVFKARTSHAVTKTTTTTWLILGTRDEPHHQSLPYLTSPGFESGLATLMELLNHAYQIMNQECLAKGSFQTTGPNQKDISCNTQPISVHSCEWDGSGRMRLNMEEISPKTLVNVNNFLRNPLVEG